jgi:hypothetical protein
MKMSDASPVMYSQNEQGLGPAKNGINPPHFPSYANAVSRTVMMKIIARIARGPRSPIRKYFLLCVAKFKL